MYWPTTKPTSVQFLDSLLSILLTTELDVDVADKMISKIVTHIHLFDFAILLLAFHENLLEKFIKDLLCLDFGKIYVRSISALGCVLGSNVKVLK